MKNYGFLIIDVFSDTGTGSTTEIITVCKRPGMSAPAGRRSHCGMVINYTCIGHKSKKGRLRGNVLDIIPRSGKSIIANRPSCRFVVID